MRQPSLAEAYLQGLIQTEAQLAGLSARAFKMERMHALMEALNWPGAELPCVHLAGTKGKGSVAVSVAHILKAAGYRVGLYTSPHLSHRRERIRILENQPRESSFLPPGEIFDDCITAQALDDLLARHRTLIDALNAAHEGRFSFFEVFTALACIYFAEAQVDCVILETGLGGRLDATNVLDAGIVALTAIDYDHTHILGKDLPTIAQQKAAIIKARARYVISAAQAPEVMAVIRARCQSFGLRPTVEGRDITVTSCSDQPQGQRVTIRGPAGIYPALVTPLCGRHQASNLAVALGVVEALKATGFEVPDSALVDGAADVCWPGRFEVIPGAPLIILDGAHNVAAARVLVETFQARFARRRVHLIVGFSKDKDVAGMGAQLRALAPQVIVTRADHPRALALSVQEGQALFAGQPVQAVASPAAAWTLAQRRAAPEEIILVTGSLFIVSDVRKLCINTKV